jgi:hypothetical protein
VQINAQFVAYWGALKLAKELDWVRDCLNGDNGVA